MFEQLTHVELDFTGLKLSDSLRSKIVTIYALYSQIDNPPEEFQQMEDSLVELMFQNATGYAVEHRETSLETPYHFWGYNYCGPGTPLERNITLNAMALT